MRAFRVLAAVALALTAIAGHAMGRLADLAVWIVRRDNACGALARGSRLRRRYSPQARFTTWIHTIAHNGLVDHWRARGLAVVSLDDESQAVLEGRGDGHRRRNGEEPLRYAIDKLREAMGDG